MMTCLGSYAAIWRTSSLPIEPPPPVIMHTLPFMKSRILPRSNSIGLRPSRSSILISLACEISSLPSPKSSSLRYGITLMSQSVFEQKLSIFRFSSSSQEGIATMIDCILCSVQMRSISGVVPSTGTPSILAPCFVMSSSTKPTASRFLDGLLSSKSALWISRRIILPA